MKHCKQNTPVITTKNVVNKESDIIYVSYDLEGDFQVFSKEEADSENVMIISVEKVLEIDPSLQKLDKIRPGEKYVRENKNSEWFPYQM